MARSSSPSSSEDEDESRLAQLRESVVTLENLKSEAKSSKSKGDGEESGFFLDVSPEFQEFVAKKLGKKLEESISWVQVDPVRQKNCSGGNDFKLEILRNIFIELNEPIAQADEAKNGSEEPQKPHKHKKLKKNKLRQDSDSDDGENLEMLREAAVDMEFLLKSTCIQAHKESLTSTKESKK